MTKRTLVITTVLAAIAVAVLAIPAIAQEPENEAAEQPVCVEHDEAAMPHDGMEEWMGEIGDEMTAADHAQMHDHIQDMMAMMHGGAHGMDSASMPGPGSLGRTGSMGAGSMMGASMGDGGMMGAGS